jgi:predicted transcriptional regulator
MKISTKLHQEQFSCTDLVRCIFNLSETDIKILQTFPDDAGVTSKHIAKTIGKDRSTVYRSLEKLIACKLCYKERLGKANRGFEDWYYLVPKQEILKEVEYNLDKCYSDVKKMLKQLDADAIW